MKNNLDFKVFVPFAKKDDEQKIVEGYASSETLDSQGEIVKASAIEAALPDYMKFANIREMHQHSAVGKAISAVMDVNKKALYLTSKIVDPVAWEKVKEGVYNGYSIGGKVVKRIGNVINELQLNEISLVDRPANPDAVFALYKAHDYNDVEREEKEMPHANIYIASELLRIAQQVCYIWELYDMKGKDTKQIENAINAIADLAENALTEDKDGNKKKAIEILDLTKKKISEKELKSLSKDSFAYIDSKGKKYLPIHNEENVLNAVSKFDEIEFGDEETKKSVARKIIIAAKREGISVKEDSSVTEFAKKYEASADTASDTWVNAYFEDVRKFV